MIFLRTHFVFCLVVMTALCFVFSSDVVLAAAGTSTATSSTQYVQLENIPGQEGSKTFPEYVKAVYSMGLGLVGLSAMFMLIVGGFMYMTSAGNTSAAGSAKGVIKDALIGLGLGLAAWLILNTINPDLTSLNFSGLATGTSTPTTPPPAPSGSLQDAAKGIDASKLATAGECKDANGAAVSPASNINEVKNGQSMTACFSGCSSGGSCTGKVNPSPTMISAINSTSGYTIDSIAGGSHSAGSAHYAGNAIDIVPTSSNRADWVSLRDNFISKGALPNNRNRSGTFCEDEHGNFMADCVGANHIHVRF